MKVARSVLMMVVLAGSVVGMGGSMVGCKSVGPDYAEPTFQAPEGWAAQIGGGMNPSAATLGNWWTGLNDSMLTNLIDRAVAGNLDLRLAEARVREARAARGIADSAGKPVVDASGGYSRSANSETTGSPIFRQDGVGEGRDLWRAGFDANWELDIFGRVRRGVEAADADIASSQWATRDVLVTLVSEVALNYVELRTAQQRILVTRSNIETQTRTLDLTDRRFKSGLTSELDVTRARSNLATTKASLPGLEAAELAAAYRLGVLVGKTPGELVTELAAVGEIPMPPAELPLGVPTDLVRRRADIRQAERDLAAQTARIGVATADLYPTFSLAGDIGLSSKKLADIVDGDSRFWSIGPGVRWNVLDFGRIRSNIAVQEARTEQLTINYERTVLTALGEVDQTIVSFSKQRERLAALGEAVSAQSRAFELANNLYAQGLVDFISVLDTQRELFQLQDQMTESKGSVTLELVRLYKALGGGWETVAAESQIQAK